MTNYELDTLAQLQAKYFVDAIKNDSELQDLLFPPRYLDVNEAADYLKVPLATLYSKVNCIPHSRVGRRLLFSERDLMRWVNSQKSSTLEVAIKPELRKVM